MHVTKPGLICKNPKQSNSRLFDYFQMTQDRQNLFVQGVLQKMIDAFFGKFSYVATITFEDRRTVIALWCNTFVSRKSS